MRIFNIIDYWFQIWFAIFFNLQFKQAWRNGTFNSFWWGSHCWACFDVSYIFLLNDEFMKNYLYNKNNKSEDRIYFKELSVKYKNFMMGFLIWNWTTLKQCKFWRVHVIHFNIWEKDFLNIKFWYEIAYKISHEKTELHTI